MTVPEPVVMIGGTPRLPGGTELFCDRAAAAVAAHGRTIRLIRVNANTSYIGLAQAGALAGTIAAIARARRAGARVAWVQVTNLAELGLVAVARVLGMRTLVTPHFGAGSRLRTHPVARRLAAVLVKRADRVALLFEGQAAEIGLSPDIPRSVIRTFLPAQSFAAVDNPSPPPVLRLVHAGRLSEAKGSLRMVALCAALARAGVPFGARIIGQADGALMARMEGEVMAAGIAAAVRFDAWLDDAALARALDEADVLVHLSTFDAYPLIVLEAMARDTYPLVYAMAGAESIVAAHGGTALPIGAPAEDAAAVLAAMGLTRVRGEAKAIGAKVRGAFAWAEAVVALERAVAEVRG